MPELETKENDIDVATVPKESEVCTAFREYAAELDARHDRHERLVKISRDVTIESKRIIFFLHSLMKSEDRSAGLDTADKRIRALVCGGLLRAAGESRMGGHSPLSGGLQELAEAVCLLHHLRSPASCTLPHWTQLTNYTSGMENVEKLRWILNPMDFILGVADYTGELMRLCINSVSDGDMKSCFIIRNEMQLIYTGFLGVKVTGSHKEMGHKLQTLRNSVLKVEAACCNLRLRGQHPSLSACPSTPPIV